MKNFRLRFLPASLTLSFILVFAIGFAPVYGQLTEPEVRSASTAKTPLQQGFSNRIGGSVYVNNFGFGISGTYSHALGPFTELTFSTGITGIRDVSEQSFTNFFTGQRVVPNKYNRALGFPFLVGLKKRVFPNLISDNFRFFFAASAGPALGLVYPYIDDADNNGYRTYQYRRIEQGKQSFVIKGAPEEKNGFFSGLGDASTQWGGAGEVKVGVDLGSSFKHQSTLEIGFFFYYFDPGLQIMESRRPIIVQQGEDQGFPKTDANGDRVNEDFFDAQKFFGTPQIKFTYSGWW